MAAGEEEEEEVRAELEAVKAVYGDDCSVFDSSPPLLHLRLVPRTADLSSQQFVEATIEIRATSQYPKEPPEIGLVDSNGLDAQRQKLLVDLVRDKATELASCLMLVALCEEAVERLSLMNHPDGDCPLCLHPLVGEDGRDKSLPFMKLMSCFHCFHCDCIIRWWNWIQTEQQTDPSGSSSSSTQHIGLDDNENGALGAGESTGNCPVCRKVFHAKDFEHMLGLVGSPSSQFSSDEITIEDDKVLNSNSENTRREKFEAALKLQQENGGLIEPKTIVSVLPGMYISLPATVTTGETDAQQERDVPLAYEANIGASSQCLNTNDPKKPGMKKPRRRNPRKPVKQWIRKEHTST